ncbi:lipoyl protein ligase domain-containing protein [Desulfosporosinus sp. BICA1-9]|uniref:lipoate--protein ligase family protein n=1 Tax=Desulfosporosinus sp. BICA1-9 TaxID=1531958 RepID=UPI00054C1DB7|nr:lipoate--protein ligase family protein [Desulfosporosinus sp. BICA1-9]KJS49506.1 MAG: ligase [Peptococcaceae bacterium BRH_c23]KJS85237.1 MAG: ligase [Desulfosporosinus sp. BICA1-9]HBW37480.1 lipoate--protein ligase family protein [Desulfosporosinus sp.]
MEFYNLGTVPWFESQVIYHALAHLNREALILCTPATPYVCAGFHQDIPSEVDLKACKELGFPLFRREVGGGLVFLDHRQVFFQVVLHRNNPIIPTNRELFYRKLLEPVVQTLRDFNLAVELRSPCDLIVNSKKISGNGAGQIGECNVLVGNILMDFNFEVMSSIIRVPSEDFRQEYLYQMQANLTTLQSEMGRAVSREEVIERLKINFARAFSLTSAQPDNRVLEEIRKLSPMFQSKEWLMEAGRRLLYREIKVAENCYIREYQVSLDITDLTCRLVLAGQRITKIALSDSNRLIPPLLLRRLEYCLQGKKMDFNTLNEACSEAHALNPLNAEILAHTLSGKNAVET